MEKKQYERPDMQSTAVIIDHLMLGASENGNSVLTSGGKASEHGITTSDSREGGCWDDEY